MITERTNNPTTFSDVKEGGAFEANGNIYLRIEVDYEYTQACSHDGLAANLRTGAVMYFDDTDEVKLAPDAKVIY